MDIYWVKDRKKCGPATVPDVVSMVQVGELTPETLGWHVGCERWMPLRELPALADFLNNAPAETDSAAPEAESGEALPPVPPIDSEPTPETAPATLQIPLFKPAAGTRLMARLVDMALYVVLVYAIVYVMGIRYTPYLLPASPVFWLGMIVLESLCLRLFQTTPGKRLFNIAIVELTPEGISGVSPMRAFARSFMVFVGGLGMMVSFLPVVMGVFSWFMLRKRGVTSWDARTAMYPIQLSAPGGMRYLLALVLLVFCMQMLATLFRPWFPDYLRDMERYAPEQVEMLQPLLPPELLPAEPPAADTAAPTDGPRFLEW